MANQAAFSSNDDVIVNNSDYVAQKSVVDPDTYFEIQYCIDFITVHDYKNVVLQFPDELMSYANYVHESIGKQTNSSIYVLGDTSYGSCCVDEVAASHVDAHVIVHFGHSCLSATQKLPVLHIFGREEIDRSDFMEKVKNKFTKTERIIVFYDVSYNHCIKEMAEELSTIYSDMVITAINTTNISNEADTPNKENITDDGSNIEKTQSCFGRTFALQHDVGSYNIFFIGEETLMLKNLIFKYNRNKVFSYSPSRKEIRLEGASVNKTLMRRYYLIEKAKDANIVGIIMGTLGVSRYKEMVTRLKRVLTHGGKKFYTFVIGKINIPKMANFMEIDIFVLVACPENSLIDSKEFYKPILTPYEIEIACLQSRQWTGDYLTDFSEILPGSLSHVDIDNEKVSSEPEYSMITGQLRCNPKSSENGCGQCTDLIKGDKEKQLLPYSAEKYLSSRSWSGLEISSGLSEIKAVEQGRCGIAMGYENEQSEK